MEHKRVSKFRARTTYTLNNNTKKPVYFVEAKYKDLETGSIDNIQVALFGSLEEANEDAYIRNLEEITKGANSAKSYFDEKIFSRFNDQSLKYEIKEINDEIMVELVNVLRSDDQAMSQAAEMIKAFSITDDVKKSIEKLGRNEQKLIVNIYVAQAILVSSVEFIKDMPDHKKQSAKAAIDLLVNIGDRLNDLNVLFAQQMQDALSQAQYNTMIIESLRLANIMTGKWDKCNTCVFADTQKSIVKKELREAIAEKGAL